MRLRSQAEARGWRPVWDFNDSQIISNPAEAMDAALNGGKVSQAEGGARAGGHQSAGRPPITRKVTIGMRPIAWKTALVSEIGWGQ